MANTSKKVYLAKIGRTRGLKGELKIHIYNPDSDLFEQGETFRISGDSGFEELTIARTNGDWVFFEEINSPEEAKPLTNKELFLYREELPELDDGTFYHEDLIGCEVFESETSDKIGILKTILYTASNDVWEVISENGQEHLIPMLEGVIEKVDLEKNRIVIHTPKTV